MSNARCRSRSNGRAWLISVLPLQIADNVIHWTVVVAPHIACSDVIAKCKMSDNWFGGMRMWKANNHQHCINNKLPKMRKIPIVVWFIISQRFAFRFRIKYTCCEIFYLQHEARGPCRRSSRFRWGFRVIGGVRELLLLVIGVEHLAFFVVSLLIALRLLTTDSHLSLYHH